MGHYLDTMHMKLLRSWALQTNSSLVVRIRSPVLGERAGEALAVADKQTPANPNSPALNTSQLVAKIGQK